MEVYIGKREGEREREGSREMEGRREEREEKVKNKRGKEREGKGGRW